MKHVVLPSREESSRLAWMGGQNGGTASGRRGQAITQLLPRRTRGAPIEIRFRRFRVRVPCGGCRRNDDGIRIRRIDCDSPEVSVPQALLKKCPCVAAVTAFEIAVAGCRIQTLGGSGMSRQLMRVPGTPRRSVLPSGAGVGAADERSRFDGNKQSFLDVWIRFDPSNMVRLRPRR